jgi:hypothetical protein
VHVVRTESNKRRSRVVFVSNQARETRAGYGFVSGDDHCQQLTRCLIECPIERQITSSEKKKIPLQCGIADGETRTRTGDTTIFSRGSRCLEHPRNPCN